MKTKTLEVTTRFSQGRELTIGGFAFKAKRLNNEEEIELQRLRLKALNSSAVQVLEREAAYLTEVINFRAVGSVRITSDFVKKNMAKVTGVKLISYLRGEAGLGKNDGVEIPTFKDEAGKTCFTIEDRSFYSRALSYEELIYGVSEVERVSAKEMADDAEEMVSRIDSLDELVKLAAENEDGLDEAQTQEIERVVESQMNSIVEEGLKTIERAKEITLVSANVCASHLNSRLVEGSQPITGEWLLQIIPDAEVARILAYLTNGEVEADATAEEPDDSEGDAPNVVGPVTA